jgi:hypothetical protein
MAKKKFGCVKKKKTHICCIYSETGTITVLNSVARIRLVKTENPSTCVTVISKIYRSAIALCYL